MILYKYFLMLLKINF